MSLNRQRDRFKVPNADFAWMEEFPRRPDNRVLSELTRASVRGLTFDTATSPSQWFNLIGARYPDVARRLAYRILQGLQSIDALRTSLQS